MGQNIRAHNVVRKYCIPTPGFHHRIRGQPQIFFSLNNINLFYSSPPGRSLPHSRKKTKPRREAGLTFQSRANFKVEAQYYCGSLLGWLFDAELPKDRLQASTFSRFNSPRSDLILFDRYLRRFKLGRKGFLSGRDDSHVHVRQVK